MTQDSNVVQLETPTGTPPPGGGGNRGSGYGERLARIEAKMDHMATREDVAEIKVLIGNREASMLRWLIGLVAFALISVVVSLIRTFF